MILRYKKSIKFAVISGLWGLDKEHPTAVPILPSQWIGICSSGDPVKAYHLNALAYVTSGDPAKAYYLNALAYVAVGAPGKAYHLNALAYVAVGGPVKASNTATSDWLAVNLQHKAIICNSK